MADTYWKVCPECGGHGEVRLDPPQRWAGDYVTRQCGCRFEDVPYGLVPVAVGALLIEDLEAAVGQMAVEYLRIERGWRDGTLSPDTRGVMATLLAAAAGEGEG